MSDFLLEILSEEMPARMQKPAIEQLSSAMHRQLSTANLTFESLDAYVTPRRLVVHVAGLPLQQPDVAIEKKGPKIDAPPQAIDGFLGSIGQTLEACEQRTLPKGVFWYYVATEQGRPTRDVLADVVAAVLDGFSWPKSMRWGQTEFRWVRPLQSLLCVFNGESVPLKWNSIVAGRRTYGHRILGGGAPIEINNFHDYKMALSDHGVVLKQDERRHLIWEEASNLAENAGLHLVEDGFLLDEVTGLVEWPVPLLGRIDAAFMDVPAEVLTASIRANQKYFTLRQGSGQMAPYFIVVANMETDDGGAAIVAGNERVLRARLSDAKFFWDKDRKKPLADFLPGLETMIFHQKLGSIAQKVTRIAALAEMLSGYISACDAVQARRAAELAKADLTTDMVFEFPELQGIMGKYYAEAHETAEAAAAIADHYSPLGPSDACPTAPVSVAVALADKLDTLLGFWAIDEKPTGSKDPFALRRAALGVIRLILENKLRVPLRTVMQQGLAAYGESVGAVAIDALLDDLLDFFADRMKVHLKETGVRHDLIAAVFALDGEDDLLRLVTRVSAVQSFLGQEHGANLVSAYKRAVSILRIEEKKDGVAYTGDARADLLIADEEQALVTALSRVSEQAESLLAAESYTDAMAVFADLRVPVDAFFEQVTVNAEATDVRVNRLNILADIRRVMHQMADFSVIEN